MKTGKTATKFISILLATVMFSSLLTACIVSTAKKSDEQIILNGD